MNEQVEQFLNDLTSNRLFADQSAHGSLAWFIRYYRRRAPQMRIAFKTSGIIALAMSISLPFALQIAPEEAKTTLASSMAWGIALTTATSAFFGWQNAWQLYTQTHLELEFALAEWELSVARARVAKTPEDAIQTLETALTKLVSKANKAIMSETSKFFSDMKRPPVRPPHS
jgi:hypothetical protein